MTAGTVLSVFTLTGIGGRNLRREDRGRIDSLLSKGGCEKIGSPHVLVLPWRENVYRNSVFSPLLGTEGARGWSEGPLDEPPGVPVNQGGH